MTHLLWLMEYPVIAENMQKKITNKFCNKIIRIDIFFDKNEREYYLTIALMGTFLRLIIFQNQTRGQLSLIQDEISDLPEVLYWTIREFSITYAKI